MKIDRKKLIRFYDEKVEGHGSHVAAITGMWGEELLLGVLQHYWKSRDEDSEIIQQSCTTGRRKGPRLDAWILKRSPNKVLYQVEVKNWSAYSLGEESLRLNCSREELEKYRRVQWAYYFGQTEIPIEAVKKVRETMKKPVGYENFRVVPLLCFWSFISEDIGKPYSTKSYGANETVDVFSASAYLRASTDDHIEIEMPRVERRLELLSDLLIDGLHSSSR